MTNEKYKHQARYAERNKEKIALYCKTKYLNDHIDGILRSSLIDTFANDDIINEAKDWYLKLDAKIIRGYPVEVKFKTILYLLLVYKYRKPLFYHEFDIHRPVKRTQGLKEKLLSEYMRIYNHEFKLQQLHPFEYLPRFVKQFNLTEEQSQEATDIITKTRDEFKFTNPKTYLGSVIYHVTKGYVTQKEIASFLQITPNGIRGIHRKLNKSVGDV